MEEGIKESEVGDIIKSSSVVLYEWSASEYMHHEKTADWFFAAGIIAFGFLVLAIILKNALFVILLIVATFSIFILGNRPPRLVVFAITSRGFKIDNRLFPFSTLDHFWLNYDPPQTKELYIVSQKMLMPQITIPLGHTDPNEIREHLAKFLEEKEIEEPMSHIIARFLRF